jgi:Ring finger domain
MCTYMHTNTYILMHIILQEDGESIDGDSGTLDYDALIELGEAIGDVKQDRWKLRARTVIAQLPSFVYSSSTNAAAAAAAAVSASSNSNTAAVKSVMITDVKCLVCMTEYEGSTVVRELPCGHIYCAECIDGYLAAHTCACPLCKRSVDVASASSSSSGAGSSGSSAAASAGRSR